MYDDLVLRDQVGLVLAPQAIPSRHARTGRLPAFDPHALAHVGRNLDATVHVVTHRHPESAASADDETLKQRRPFRMISPCRRREWTGHEHPTRQEGREARDRQWHMVPPTMTAHLVPVERPP